MKRRFIFALILVGFTSMGAQIVLMRELLVVFYGNELSLGVTLASWLFWVALGSWGIARWIVNKIGAKATIFAWSQIILAFLLPITILAIRFIPRVLQFSPGEIVGILPMSLSTFILLSPVCILGGFLFVLGCEIYKGKVKEGAIQIGYVYILEAIGATLGGLLLSLWLIRFFSPLYIMFLVGFLNLLAAIVILLGKKNLNFWPAIFILSLIFFISGGKIENLRQFSLSQQWRTYQLLASKNSVYGNIAVTKRENVFTIFTNGLYAFSVPDKLTSERNAHFPLLEHNNPKEVLLIGGGSSGQLREVLKHPVERVDYVELDPLVINLAKEYLPPNKAFNDSRVKIITNMDGRLFIKRTSKKYDVVIINLPEPYTAQLNRFYTRQFYQEVKNILKDKGILSFALYSNPNYISQEQSQLYLTLKKTLQDIFAEVKITPGEVNYFLASRQKGLLTLDWQILMQRLNERNIKAKYMREYYLYSDLSAERINFFNQRLSQSKVMAINTDFRPLAYYYDMVLWSTYFKYNLKSLFKAITPQKIYIATIAFYLILLIPVLIKRLRPRIPNWGILTCVGTTGFAEITFQIVTLLSFQVLYGYVYYKLGIILTSYMMGLIFGGWLITKRLNEGKTDYRLFIKTQIAIFIYPLILPFLFLVFTKFESRLSFLLGSNIIFPFLPLIPGFIGGYQFPLANSLYIKTAKTQVSYSAGLTYGLDIFGSCLGAVLVTVFLLPIIGIPMICLLVAGLNLIGLILLLTKI